jgi:hypothetical protein
LESSEKYDAMSGPMISSSGELGGVFGDLFLRE